MGKGGSQTIGYTYYMTLLMGIGRSVSELVEIKVGDKSAWRGPLCRPDTNFFINARNLFGGDDKEGGILGPGRVMWGDADQTLPGSEVINGKRLPGVKEMISPNAPMPAMRGVTTIWYDGEITSMNPYPKEWKFRARRHIHGWYDDNPWYPQKCVIYLSAPEVVEEKRAVQLGDVLLAFFRGKGGSKKKSVVMNIPGNIKAMNGSHIIYQCVTDPIWGRSQEPEMIDENSFIYAANTLCNERFGLCFNWQREDDVDAFIQVVLDHIGGVLYTDRSTGLLTLRLIRNDYNPDTLPTFSFGSGLLDILRDDSGSQDIAYNEVIVKYHDPISDTDGEARAQNAGARMAQGSINPITKEYPGLPTKELAARVAVRELIVQSAGLKKFKVKLDRSAWRIAPGMPFKIKAPERGYPEIILRAGEVVDYSTRNGGHIEIAALEDVFSMPTAGMVIPEDSVWSPPVTDPVAPDASQLFELTYYDLVGNLSQFDISAVSDDDAYMGMVASQPLPSQIQYDLMVDDTIGTDFEKAGTFAFTGNATLLAAIGFFDTELSVGTMEGFEPAIGHCLMIGEERLRVDGFDPLTGIVTVARGTVDTIPAKHAAGEIVWWVDDDLASNGVVYSPGDEIAAAAATRSSSAVLTAEDWDIQNLTIAGRVGAPYPPADFKVDGVSVLTATGEFQNPVFTWVPRNRITQQDQLVAHTEGPVAAEPGTVYEVEIYNKAGVLLSTHAVGEDLTFTYGGVEQAADNDPTSIRVNVVAVRDGHRSLANYAAPVVLKGGYGYGYGLNYGGQGSS